MKYSTDELIQCIYDFIEESLPISFDYATLTATVEVGKVSTQFIYMNPETDQEEQLQLQNNVAPMNALHFLQQNMAAEGDNWTKIRIKITPDCSCEIAHN